jgi:plasmid stabilization system protein ParE
MAEIVLLASAKADFDAAFNWYAARSESAATRFTEEVANTIERAAHQPDRFGRLDTVHRQARVKRFPFGIFYQLTGTTIEIFAVLDCRQDPEAIESRLRGYE